jgi:hypothetical protein
VVWQSLLSISLTDAQRRNASAFRLRHFQSLLRRRQRFSQAMVRSTTSPACRRGHGESRRGVSPLGAPHFWHDVHPASGLCNSLFFHSWQRPEFAPEHCALYSVIKIALQSWLSVLALFADRVERTGAKGLALVTGRAGRRSPVGRQGPATTPTETDSAITSVSLLDVITQGQGYGAMWLMRSVHWE